MHSENPEADNTIEPENELDPNEPYPVVINPFHFALLCLATMGVYCIWWQYKCWVYFRDKEKSNTLPALWALLFLILALPLIPLLSKISAYCRLYTQKVMFNPIVIWLACLSINFAGYFMKDSHPVFAPLVGVFIFAPLILPVMEFNFYFTGNRMGYKGDKFNSRQVVLLIFGAFLWAAVINAIATGNFPPPDPFK
jgi:hypothetical protein